jgi:hypothetical protein
MRNLKQINKELRQIVIDLNSNNEVSNLSSITCISMAIRAIQQAAGDINLAIKLQKIKEVK